MTDSERERVRESHAWCAQRTERVRSSLGQASVGTVRGLSARLASSPDHADSRPSQRLTFSRPGDQTGACIIVARSPRAVVVANSFSLARTYFRTLHSRY